MIKAFKKHISKPWYKVKKYKRVYENRGEYFRRRKIPTTPIMLVK